jgi:glucose-1-phosphate thymidylyltransferase
MAAGTGSRLNPLTSVVNKHLLPVYNKPMIYYPLATLMLAGIKEIAIIVNSEDAKIYKKILGDGNKFGIKLSYLIQKEPNGIAAAFIIANEFIGDQNVALILGDNFFYGQGLGQTLKEINKNLIGATIFAYSVNNPQDYGVVEFDQYKNAVSITEKPSNPKSNYAVTGLYFYNNSVLKIAKNIRMSERGELEISDINSKYLELKTLEVVLLPRGTTWLDLGTFENLNNAANYVKILEDRQGNLVSSPEEIALRNNWIGKKELNNLIVESELNSYQVKLKNLSENLE